VLHFNVLKKNKKKQNKTVFVAFTLANSSHAVIRDWRSGVAVDAANLFP